ncbi:flagellar protein FlaG [Bacillus infantis]|uniref:flagellar protein FlaG n=1 Tax=Bacillus infantis TaxID=324767 RepID=UPI001CD557B8|nr:flagellar protein FlaG [Bacillus infantis]MCA1033712.1 flagellar protein FlaG [Bacillus infantis]
MIERLSGQSVAYSSRTSSHDNVDTQTTKESTNTNNLKDENVGAIEVKKEKLDNIIDGMNEFLQPSNTSLKFELHEKLNEYYVTIVDDITHEVVKEIPSKKMLDMYAAMTEFVGLMVDKKI